MTCAGKTGCRRTPFRTSADLRRTTCRRDGVAGNLGAGGVLGWVGGSGGEARQAGGEPVNEARAPAERLDVSQGPRLEVDQLLAQVVARAEDVVGAQGRLRGVLVAN